MKRSRHSNKPPGSILGPHSRWRAWVEAKVMKFEQADEPDILDDTRRDLEAAESLSPDSPRL